MFYNVAFPRRGTSFTLTFSNSYYSDANICDQDLFGDVNNKTDPLILGCSVKVGKLAFLFNVTIHQSQVGVLNFSITTITTKPATMLYRVVPQPQKSKENLLALIVFLYVFEDKERSSSTQKCVIQ